ncbi:MAG: hypothetical protein JXA73_20035, partial [Acidobacteria bacterium]|nr:hypothetical protein [Acidobacteriota bacterium]
MITRREFSKIGLGMTVFSGSVHAMLGSGEGDDAHSILSPREWAGSRRVGIRVNGSYWGGNNEQIDMLSGNLNYSLPLVTAGGRGKYLKILCSYNSQIWEHDSKKTLAYANDVGFGYGWRIQIGSIVPKLSEKECVGYTFINNSGAEYPLSFSQGVWISLQGLYISYDPSKERLQFPDGTFWIMGCASSAGEADAGTKHPTLIQDRNGNQIIIRYMKGCDSNDINSSARIQEIQDSQAVDSASGRKTYSFIYDAGQVPHLLTIINHISNAEIWSFAYEAQNLSSPFGGHDGHGPIHILKCIQKETAPPQSFSYNSFGELQQVHMPYGACYRWDYVSGQNGVRRVIQRGIVLSQGKQEAIYKISTNNPKKSRYLTTLAEPHNFAKRIGSFDGDPQSSTYGLLSALEELDRYNKVLRRTTNLWKMTSSGVPYIGTISISLDPDTPDEAISKNEFDRDLFGNLVESKRYDFNILSKPIAVVRNRYMMDPSYISQGICNLLLTTSISNETETIELRRNQYDSTPLVDRSNLSEHDPYYGPSLTIRGNLTVSTVGEVYHRIKYDITGQIISFEDGVGSQLAFTDDKMENNTRIQKIIPNQNEALALQTMSTTNRKGVEILSPSGGKIEISADDCGRKMSVSNSDGIEESLS